MERKQPINPGRLSNRVSVWIDHAHPIDNRFAGALIFQFTSDRIQSIRLFQIRADGGKFVRQDGVIFLKGVTNNDPVKDTEAAREQKSGAEGKEKNELGCDRTLSLL